MRITGTKVVLNLTGADHMKHVEPDDFVIHLRSFQGGIEHSRHVGKVSNAYTVFSPFETVEPRFYRWALKSDGFIQELRAMTQQLRDGQSIKFEQFAEIGLPLPPVEEQRRIADFLDDQVARVDNIIAARQQQGEASLALLEAWLSEEYDGLSAQFGLRPMRHASRSVRQGWSPQCEDRLPDQGEWGVLKAGCVNGGEFRPDEVKALPPGQIPRSVYRVYEGDLLVNRASGSLQLIGSCAVARGVRPLTLLCDKVYRVEVLDSVRADYVAATWRSRQVRERIRLAVSGAEGMANSLPSEAIRAVPLPDLSSQQQGDWLAQYQIVAGQTASGVHQMEASVSVLQELKRSLISAAVLGEFDVSSAAGRGVPA